jgi:tellurite resistance protein TerC
MIRHAKRLVIFGLGFSVLLVGIAMIVLPGPAFIVIPAGLAILATEFVWARHLLKKIKEQAMSITANCGRSVSTLSKQELSPTASRHGDSDSAQNR